jgi:signal transduction histidine kinase
VTRVALIVLAVALSVAAAGALSWRSHEQRRSTVAAENVSQLDLIEVRTRGSSAMTSLRLDALSAGRSGASTVDLGPAIAVVNDLKTQLAPMAETEGPLATEAALLVAALDSWVRQPAGDDFYATMSHLDRLTLEMAFAGQSGSLRSSSEDVGSVDSLAFSAGGLAYSLNKYLAEEALVEDAGAGEIGYGRYVEMGAALPRFGAFPGSSDDPLLVYVPADLEQEDPVLYDRFVQALHTPAADTLRDSLLWATNGGASSNVAPPATFEDVMAATHQVAADQQAALSETIADQVGELQAAGDRSATMQRVLLFAAWLGYIAAAVLLGFQLVGLMKIQHESEIRRREAQAKLDMVSVVAHELRSPLTGITGFAQFLHSDWHTLPDEQIRTFLDLIKDQSDEVMRLIDDLLTVRRIEAGSLDLELRAVNIRDLTRRFETTLFDEPGRSLIVDLPEQLSVKCDPDRMTQILRNYLDNARKYGGATVRVTTTNIDGVCRISVSDDGEGVPDEDVERIFSRFDQGSTAGRSDTGFGLGLSIVMSLASAMGGDAGYTPVIPHGAEFWVEVPLASVPSDVALATT